MNNIKEITLQWLREDDWKYQEEPESSIIRAGVGGKNLSFNLVFICEEEKQVFQVVALTQVRIPENFRREVAELMTRINYSLLLGSLKMDMDDGELRYEVAIDVEDGCLTPCMVKRCSLTACCSFDKAFPHLMSIIYGGKTAEEAFLSWKNDRNDEVQMS